MLLSMIFSWPSWWMANWQMEKMSESRVSGEFGSLVSRDARTSVNRPDLMKPGIRPGSFEHI